VSAIRQPTSLHQTQDRPKLVSIPAGWFLMGSEDGQDNERPVHRVWVDDFRLGECQVTNAEYTCFVHATGA
jgi:formylglycine-generating enzyme required for sulfatase activity